MNSLGNLPHDHYFLFFVAMPIRGFFEHLHPYHLQQAELALYSGASRYYFEDAIQVGDYTPLGIYNTNHATRYLLSIPLYAYPEVKALPMLQWLRTNNPRLRYELRDVPFWLGTIDNLSNMLGIPYKAS